jgi:hypothetical protein
MAVYPNERFTAVVFEGQLFTGADFGAILREDDTTYLYDFIAGYSDGIAPELPVFCDALTAYQTLGDESRRKLVTAASVVTNATVTLGPSYLASDYSDGNQVQAKGVQTTAGPSSNVLWDWTPVSAACNAVALGLQLTQTVVGRVRWLATRFGWRNAGNL